MELYDEKSFAEEMYNNQSFIKGFSVSELTIYAKWLKYIEIVKLNGEYSFDNLSDDDLSKIDGVVEANLIDFSTKHYGAFNYVLDYKKIDSAMENSRKYKLRLPLPVPITKKEWNVILSLDDENRRRVLLVMLIDAKYNMYYDTIIGNNTVVNDSTIFYVQIKTCSNILKMAGVKIPKEEQKGYISYFRDMGLTDITEGRKNVRYVKFVDIDPDSEILDYITDYKHLNLYYDKFISPGKIGICQYCGDLFRKGKNGKGTFCRKHTGRIVESTNFKYCVDCGKPFNYKHNKIRCDECQIESIKEKKRIWWINRNNNN